MAVLDNIELYKKKRVIILFLYIIMDVVNKKLRALDLRLFQLFEEIMNLKFTEKGEENEKKIEELRNEYYKVDKELELFKIENNYIEPVDELVMKVNSGGSSRAPILVASLIQPVDVKGQTDNIKKKASKWNF